MKKYSLIYIVSMICFLVIAPSCVRIWMKIRRDKWSQMTFMRILL